MRPMKCKGRTKHTMYRRMLAIVLAIAMSFSFATMAAMALAVKNGSEVNEF